MERFTTEWADAWAAELKKDTPWAESSESWTWPLLIRVTGHSSWLMDLFRGVCRSIEPAANGTEADFILAADRATWDRILDGEQSPMVAIMRGSVKLEKGSMLTLGRYAKSATLLLEAAMRAEGNGTKGSTVVLEPMGGDGAPVSDHHDSFRTTSGKGLDMESVPMQLFQKGKKLGVWDPYDLDMTADRTQWSGLTSEEKRLLIHLLAVFQAGEEAVTLDLLPMMRALALDGRLEEEIYLTSFLFEEAKHVEFFQRIFSEVIALEDDLTHLHTPSYRKLFYEELPAVMNRLDSDASAEALIAASVTYNMVVEGTLAETGYHAFYTILESRGIMPGVTEGVRLLQRDESRHVAFGVHLITRLIREKPGLMQVFQARMSELIPLAVASISELFAAYDPMPFGLREEDFVQFAMDQFGKRMRRIEIGSVRSSALAESSLN
ncbi:MAG: R2-like ligand-binding oxidase [Bacteroidota bacterium]|nr:R2-like ligand-binding oxidase [Bacteroidota bacterium]